jgi:WD40 repeat protein
LETVSARLKKRFPHPNAGGRLDGLQYSPDGKRIIARDSPGGVVQVWDAETGQWLTRIQTVETGATGPDGSFQVSADFKTLYASMKLCEQRSLERIEKDGKPFHRWTFRGEVRAWDLETGKELARFKHTPQREIAVLRLSPDASSFITDERFPGDFEPGKQKTGSTIWDARTFLPRPLPSGLEYHPLFAPDSRSFAVTTLDGDGHATSIKIIDVVTLDPKLTIPITQERSWVYLHAFSPDGRVMIGCVQSFSPAKDFRMAVTFWDTATGEQMASFPMEEQNIFVNGSPAFSPDGRTVAFAYAYGPRYALAKEPKVYLFETATGKLARSINLGPPQLAGKVVYSPDGQRLAVMTKPKFDGLAAGLESPQDWPQHRIHLIDLSTAKIGETLISPQSHSFWSLCFSPDGKTLASGGYGEVLLWDVSQPPGSPKQAPSP